MQALALCTARWHRLAGLGLQTQTPRSRTASRSSPGWAGRQAGGISGSLGPCTCVLLWVGGRGGSLYIAVRGIRYGGTCSQAGCGAGWIMSIVQRAECSSSSRPAAPKRASLLQWSLLALLPAASLRALRRLTRPRTQVERGQSALHPGPHGHSLPTWRMHIGCSLAAASRPCLASCCRCAASAILLACVVCVADHVRAWKGTTPAS